jgi:ferritin-like metal-binding protein YciE
LKELVAMTQDEILVDWLSDAYAMESGQIPVLSDHIKDAGHHAEVRTRLQQHLDATRRHADLLGRLIEQCGGKVPAVKATMGKVTGVIHAVAGSGGRARLLKNLILDYSTEYFEVGCYTALIEAAMLSGHGELIPALEEVLEEEEDMAGWIEDRLPGFVELSMQEGAAVSN